MGTNDLCGWDGTLTPTATFKAQFAETLEILRTGLPGSHRCTSLWGTGSWSSSI
jgi:hypothetical protein